MGHYVPLDADRQKRKGLCDGIANDSSKRFPHTTQCDSATGPLEQAGATAPGPPPT